MEILNKYTDPMLFELEARIKKVYAKARDDYDELSKDYFEKLKKRDLQMRKELEAGHITAEQYKNWRLTQMARGNRFNIMRDECAARAVNAAKIAVKYINETTPMAVAMGHNFGAYDIERVGYDMQVGRSFAMWNEDTVRRLIVDEPDLLPQAKIDIPKENQWNRNKITSEITAGILLGEDITKIAQRMDKIINGDYSAAVRTARTAMTYAQNLGMLDTYEQAIRLGIKVKKRWYATKDNLTRHSHRLLDGQTKDIDKMFVSSLGSHMECPGDSSHGAHGADIYNCRCCMITVDKYDDPDEPRMMRVRDPKTHKNVLVRDMTYREWMEGKGLDINGKPAKNRV